MSGLGNTKIMIDCAHKSLPALRYVGVMPLLFLIAPLALIGMGSGEDDQ
jgi:hypothetical protein